MVNIAQRKLHWFVDQVEKLQKEEGFTQAQISETLGVMPQYLNAILKGRRNLSDKFLAKFINKFSINQNDLPEILKGEHYVSDVSSEYITHEGAIPFYNIAASAGIEFFFNNQQTTPDDTIKIPFNINGGSVAIPIHGNSMAPEYKSGDIIIIREIKDKSIIEFGAAHVIITEEQRLFKVIRFESDKLVRLVSINQEYDDMMLPTNKIIKLFKVLGSISKKTT